MKRVLITFAEKPTPEYPLVVVVLDDTPGALIPRGQEHMVRSVRDGRLFANGMCAGGVWASDGRRAPHDWPVNPELDPRLKDV